MPIYAPDVLGVSVALPLAHLGRDGCINKHPNHERMKRLKYKFFAVCMVKSKREEWKKGKERRKKTHHIDYANVDRASLNGESN